MRWFPCRELSFSCASHPHKFLSCTHALRFSSLAEQKPSHPGKSHVSSLRSIRGVAINTRRTLELTIDQRTFWPSLGDSVAVGAVGTVREGTIASTAHHLGAEFTRRTLDWTGADRIRFDVPCGITGGDRRRQGICSNVSISVFYPIQIRKSYMPLTRDCGEHQSQCRNFEVHDVSRVWSFPGARVDSRESTLGGLGSWGDFLRYRERFPAPQIGAYSRFYMHCPVPTTSLQAQPRLGILMLAFLDRLTSSSVLHFEEGSQRIICVLQRAKILGFLFIRLMIEYDRVCHQRYSHASVLSRQRVLWKLARSVRRRPAPRTRWLGHSPWLVDVSSLCSRNPW